MTCLLLISCAIMRRPLPYWLRRLERVVTLVMFLSVGIASDHIGPGPWVEMTGFVHEVNGSIVVVQGVRVDISRAEVDIWQPLEAGFLVDVEGWLDTSVTPVVLIASEFDLEGIGYDYERADNRGNGRGNRGQHDDDDWDDDDDDWD
jgi:hypothetical protein